MLNRFRLFDTKQVLGVITLPIHRPVDLVQVGLWWRRRVSVVLLEPLPVPDVIGPTSAKTGFDPEAVPLDPLDAAVVIQGEDPQGIVQFLLQSDEPSVVIPSGRIVRTHPLLQPLQNE